MTNAENTTILTYITFIRFPETNHPVRASGAKHDKYRKNLPFASDQAFLKAGKPDSPIAIRGSIVQILIETRTVTGMTKSRIIPILVSGGDFALLSQTGKVKIPALWPDPNADVSHAISINANAGTTKTKILMHASIAPLKGFNPGDFPVHRLMAQTDIAELTKRYIRTSSVVNKKLNQTQLFLNADG